MSLRRPLIGILILGLVACGEETETGDLGTPTDASPTDAGTRDAQAPSDATPGDASGDAGIADVPIADAGGTPDAQDQDGGELDAEPADLGPPDLGPACVADLACATNPGAPCLSGKTACTPNEVCVDDAPVRDGVTCTGGACLSGACLPTTTIANNVNLSTTPVTTGRACAEAPAYSVIGLLAQSATLTSTPAAGCLVPDDEVLLINLQGSVGSFDSVGNWELLQVATLTANTVTFSAPKQRSYGDPLGSDQTIGVADGEQKVALIRVPHFGALDVSQGAIVTANAWDGTLGGVLALRAGHLGLAGTLDAAHLGYRTGRWSQDAACTTNLATEAGESISGPGGPALAANVGGSGGIGGLANLSFNNNTPVCASAGHAVDGEPGFNPNGRAIGDPGVAYGVNDGSQLTMGSGAGGNLTCDLNSPPAHYIDSFDPAGGIVLLLLGDLDVAGLGQITARPPNASRDLAPSGGYVLIRGHDLNLGNQQVNAMGALGYGSSPATSGLFVTASPGYVVLEHTGTVTGTTTPPATDIPR